MKYQGFLIGQRLRKVAFTPSENMDHEHCNMCGAKFSSAPDDLHEGYATEDGVNWVCPACELQYKDEYAWTVSK